MEDKIQYYRQPMVTASGIIMGFILNFSASFVKSESSLNDYFYYLIGVFILIGIFSLIIVLYRILKMNNNNYNAEKYYRKTLNFFIFGVSISFLGVMIDMLSSFMT